MADEWVREVDGRGQAWVWARNPELGALHRFPDEPGVTDGLGARGWEPTGPPTEEQESEAASLEDLKKAELQAKAEEAGLSTSGTKQDLIDRLHEDEAPVESDNPEEQ